MPNEVTKLEDGRISAKLETGEVFEGDALEVTQKMAEAHVSTKRWGQEWKQKAEAVQPPPAPVQPPVDANEKATQDWLLNQHAKALGYNSAEEYKADLNRVKSSTEEVAKATALQNFFTQHPEYPATPEANDAIGKIFDEMGWQDMTSTNLHLAHLEAMNRHQRDPKQGYEPLSAEAINSAWANNMAAASRPQAPPMLRTNNPEISSSAPDVYKMPLADLRNAAIQQELGRK